MAIIKTTPPSEMTVGEYRNAALRHFNTCKVLWRYVSLPDTSNLKGIPEDEILKNLFYLTGYVAECAVKYRYLTDCHSLNDSHSESNWGKAKVRRHLSFVTTAPRDKEWSEEAIQHLCSSVAARPVPVYLQNLGNANAIMPVPTIEKDMQASWEPSIRYHYAINGLPLPPNKSDIETFYQATKSLLHSLSIL